MDCTVVTVILCKRFDSHCFWAYRVLSGLAEPAHAGPVYTGILFDVLQIPQHVASKGIVRKISGIRASCIVVFFNLESILTTDQSIYLQIMRLVETAYYSKLHLDQIPAIQHIL